MAELSETLKKLRSAGFEIWEGKKRFSFTSGGIHGDYKAAAGANTTRRVYSPDGGHAVITKEGYLRNEGMSDADFSYLLEKSECEKEPKKLTKAQKDRARRKIRAAHPAMKELLRVLEGLTLTDEQKDQLDLEGDSFNQSYFLMRSFGGKNADGSLIVARDYKLWEMFEAAQSQVNQQWKDAGVWN